MQTIVQVICSAGESLRDAIGADETIEKYHLTVTSQQMAGRSPGWTKLHSAADPPKPGAINIEWNPRAATLTCRIITRGHRKPSPIVGDLVTYLVSRFIGRVRTITIVPRRRA